MSQKHHPLTRVQLAKKFGWQDNFPKQIQDQMFHHYQMFNHGGNANLALSDIQSVSDTLYNATLNKPMAAFLQEHRQFFGSASADDLSFMIKTLAQLRQQIPKKGKE